MVLPATQFACTSTFIHTKTHKFRQEVSSLPIKDFCIFMMFRRPMMITKYVSLKMLTQYQLFMS